VLVCHFEFGESGGLVVRGFPARGRRK